MFNLILTTSPDNEPDIIFSGIDEQKLFMWMFIFMFVIACGLFAYVCYLKLKISKLEDKVDEIKDNKNEISKN